MGGPAASSASHCAAKSGDLASAASAGTGGPQLPRNSRMRASCAASRCGGGSGIHRLSWNAPLVLPRTSAAQAAISAGFISSAPHEPSPPASATAIDSAGAGTPAIGASRIGRRRLKRAQNAFVRSRTGVMRRIVARAGARHNSKSASVPFEPDEGAELLGCGARRAEAVSGMLAVAVADRDGAKEHVRRRDREELADDPVHARPGFLRAGVEPVAAREIHQRVDVAAEIGPLAGAELALDGDEQRERRVEEHEVALVLVEPALRVVARDLERAVELHAVLLAPRLVRLPDRVRVDRVLRLLVPRVVVAGDVRRDAPLALG